MIEQFFDDPRHRQSEELAFFAERAERAGDMVKALHGYAEAARLEEQIALDVPAGEPKLRSLLAISAVALWLRAERWDEAARVGCSFLARPQDLLPGGCREIQVMVEQAWRATEMEEVIGKDGAYASLEAKLSGGLVRVGLAPSTVVAERRDVLSMLLLRVAEWRSNRKYRRTGPSSLAGRYEFFEAPALAGSYALRLYIGAAASDAPEAIASPSDVVEHLLSLARAIAEGPERMAELVEDGAYAKAFLRAFRDLAPDGKSVARVDLGAIVRGRTAQSTGLTPETRALLTTTLRKPGEAKALQVDGVLKSVNLRGGEPRIGVDTEAGARVFRIVKGEHDDTIGPKLNHRVRIVGMRRIDDSGEADDWASDVLVVDDAPASVRGGAP